MQHLSSILLVENDTVNNHQGLSIHVEGVESLNKGHATHTLRTIARGGIGIGTQLLLQLFLDVHGTAISKA